MLWKLMAVRLKWHWQGLRLSNGEGLTPSAPAPQPDQGETGGIGSTLELDLALLIQGKLFAQNEVCCGERCGGMQTEPEEVGRIHQERQQRAGQLHQMMERARDSQHMQGTLLRQRHHSWLLSLLGTCLSS